MKAVILVVFVLTVAAVLCLPGAAVFQGDRGRCCIPQAERAEKGKEDRVFKRSAQ